MIGIPLLALWMMLVQFNVYLALGLVIVVVLVIGRLWLLDKRRFAALRPDEQSAKRNRLATESAERAANAEAARLRSKDYPKCGNCGARDWVPAGPMKVSSRGWPYSHFDCRSCGVRSTLDRNGKKWSYR